MIVDEAVFTDAYLPETLRHRDAEVATLAHAFDPALRGEAPEHVLLSGPHGVGKTALCRHTFERLQRQADAQYAHVRAMGKSIAGVVRATLRELGAELAPTNAFTERFGLELTPVQNFNRAKYVDSDPSPMPQEVLFRETQHMRQPWIWALIVLVSVPPILFGVVMVGDSGLAFGSVVGLFVILAVAVLFYSIQLTTEVRDDGIYVRFAPFHRSFRRLPVDQIERIERTEFGLLTYGGIGIRWTPDTVAYMTARGSGIKIDRESAQSVVIGSQEPSALMTAIDKLR